jgi:hypothetical protein
MESADLSKAAEAEGKKAVRRVPGRSGANAAAKRESPEIPEVRNFSGSSLSRSHRGCPAA